MAPFENRLAIENALVRTIAILVIVAIGIMLMMPETARCAETPNFLVAKPDLPDPLFQQSVILMLPPLVHSNPMGVIINKAMAIPVSRVFPHAVALTAPADTVYFGGPVAPDEPFLIRRTSAPTDKELHVFGDLYLSLDPRAMAEILKDPHLDKTNLRLFLGFAQWDEDQLRAEKMENSWYEVPARLDLVFGDPKGLWNQMVDRAQLQEVNESPTDTAFAILRCTVQLPALSNPNRSDQ
ncbi:MAG: YqgE/AlgH family protein [Candidatus Binataceae bacterium]